MGGEGARRERREIWECMGAGVVTRVLCRLVWVECCCPCRARVLTSRPREVHRRVLRRVLRLRRPSPGWKARPKLRSPQRCHRHRLRIQWPVLLGCRNPDGQVLEDRRLERSLRRLRRRRGKGRRRGARELQETPGSLRGQSGLNINQLTFPSDLGAHTVLLGAKIISPIVGNLLLSMRYLKCILIIVTSSATTRRSP